MWAVGCCREAVPVSLGISDCLGVACAGIERRPSAFQHAPSARSSARHHRRNESWALRLSIEPQLVRSIHVIEYDKDRRAESGIDMQRFFVSTALLCPRRLLGPARVVLLDSERPIRRTRIARICLWFPSSLLSLATAHGEGTPGLNQTGRGAGYSYWS
jgi:hypothetical protein